ncbi:beta-ketoacyl-ACP synthase III [Streptomyces sp. 8K308]|uniref:3-oxoacyl-ACP synthase III family protein n=1 Tax=Streptomyces sp. 8K308 TaxID=2530388 RepID=UPI00104985C0|nr:beta-ketoacyl-ACP synthase 3 [Streptomyces sp. 8K308]TDC26043.1 beta-ketoacyl-ACP synthase III [Streptomyces sp. 8K308]
MTAFPEGTPGTGIVGVGSHLPSQVVSNSVVAARAGVTPEWIVRKTTIRERRYAGQYEATSDLAVKAAEAALADAGITADQLGWVLVATSTPDQPQPATACLVQHQIGAHRAAAFDINAVCAGFVFALAAGARLMSGTGGYGLVIGADVYSRIIDPSDRKTAILFGDGAGAVVLGPVPRDRGFVGGGMSSRGDLSGLIRVEAGGSRVPASKESVIDGSHHFRMDGRGVREFVTDQLPVAVANVLDANGLIGDDVDHFVPHQANGALLADVWPLLGLGRARQVLTVERHGNTSAASIPIALDHARRDGTFADGDLLLLAGFGGGMSVATALIRWHGGPTAGAGGAPRAD